MPIVWRLTNPFVFRCRLPLPLPLPIWLPTAAVFPTPIINNNNDIEIWPICIMNSDNESNNMASKDTNKDIKNKEKRTKKKKNGYDIGLENNLNIKNKEENNNSNSNYNINC